MSTTPWIAPTRDRYRAGGLAGTLPAGRRPAVVVVDLQRGFTEPEFAPGSDLSDVVAATRTVVDRARERGLPVLFTAIAFTEQELETVVWLRKMPAMRVLRHGGPALELDPRLGRRDDEPVLVKTAASAFFATDLDRRLRDAEADSLLVCGTTTSGCVRATVVDGCSLNWPTFVAVDCVGDREPGPHEASLLDMEAKYADLVDGAAVQTLLAQAAGR